MTDHSERDEAAHHYIQSEYIRRVKEHGSPVDEIERSFKAGADWAVKNDPRVLKLVEAVKVYAALEKATTEICGEPFHGDLAIRALTEWSKP